MRSVCLQQHLIRQRLLLVLSGCETQSLQLDVELVAVEDDAQAVEAELTAVQGDDVLPGGERNQANRRIGAGPGDPGG